MEISAETVKITRKHVRCRMLGTSRPNDYFDQDMSFGWHKDVLYLRIGNDVYEGRELTDRTPGASIHFSVSDSHGRVADCDAPFGAGNVLCDLTTCLTDYTFWPAGKFSEESEIVQEITEPEVCNGKGENTSSSAAVPLIYPDVAGQVDLAIPMDEPSGETPEIQLPVTQDVNSAPRMTESQLLDSLLQQLGIG